MEPEHLILERLRAGDHQALAALIDLHKDRAYTLAFRILGSREEAEEVVQDGFLRVYRHIGSFRGDASFGTWLYRIIFNLSMTVRSRRRHVVQPVETLTEELSENSGDDRPLDALDRLEQQEQAALLGRAVRSLPENHRVAVDLFYLQEQSYEEIAAIMDIPLGTVKTYLFRARKRLKVLLGRAMDEKVRAA